MNDLFAQDGPEVLDLPDADIFLQRNFDLGLDYSASFNHLKNDIPWFQAEIKINGKAFMQPRFLAWYGDQGVSYTYSGLTLDPLPWTEELLAIKAKVEAFCQHDFNGLLLNYYRDGDDTMGMHADNEAMLGPRPVIASLSFGECREFLLKHKNKKSLDTFKLALGSGDLLVMKGNTQKYWKHGIGKEGSACGERINLTFRQVFV